MHTSITAISIPHKEIALGHLPQVIFVQELAALALLAQTAEPVLAYEIVEVAIIALCDVTVRARIAHGAVTLEIRLAYWPCVRDAEALRGEEEGAKGERVAGVLMRNNLLGELVWPGS